MFILFLLGKVLKNILFEDLSLNIGPPPPRGFCGRLMKKYVFFGLIIRGFPSFC